jgi:hypothetical protein
MRDEEKKILTADNMFYNTLSAMTTTANTTFYLRRIRQSVPLSRSIGLARLQESLTISSSMIKVVLRSAKHVLHVTFAVEVGFFFCFVVKATSFLINKE